MPCRCAGYQDFLFVVDSSSSVENIHDAQSSYVKDFATILSNDFDEPLSNEYGSPISTQYQSRIGMVTFFGPCITC